MKIKLQYAYSISVFIGVLLTAYMMMSQDGGQRVGRRTLQPTPYRTEAAAGDPAVNALLEMESALVRGSQKPPTKADERRPTHTRPR